MPREWRASTVIPLYENKGDIQDCNNFRGIKLRSHTMNLWESVIERRLREDVEVSENQFGFMPGRSCLLYTSPSPRDGLLSRMPSSA